MVYIIYLSVCLVLFYEVGLFGWEEFNWFLQKGPIH